MGRPTPQAPAIAKAHVLELTDEPPMPRTEGRVAAMNGEEKHSGVFVGPRFGMDADELSAAQIVAGEMLRQVAPAEVRAQKGVLGGKIGDAPRARREDTLIRNAGLVSLGEDDLDRFREARDRDAPLQECERMAWTDHGQHTHRREGLPFEPRRDAGLAHDTEASRPSTIPAVSRLSSSTSSKTRRAAARTDLP